MNGIFLALLSMTNLFFFLVMHITGQKSELRHCLLHFTNTSINQHHLHINNDIVKILNRFFPLSAACKTSYGFTNQFAGGIMAILMGLATLVRLTRNMPRKITEVALYGNSVYYDGKGNMIKAPAISIDDHMAMMKRMADLEEKVNVLSMRPAMPPEKEELLNSALSRVSTLEQELATAKKVWFSSILECYYACLVFSCKTYD